MIYRNPEYDNIFLFSCVPKEKCKGLDLVPLRTFQIEDRKAYLISTAEAAECDNSDDVCCILDNEIPDIEGKMCLEIPGYK